MAETDLIEVRLNAIRYGARDTNLYEFVRPDGKPLPAYEPGAHIDVHLPNGIVRQYSLILPAREPADLYARRQARSGEPRRLALRARRVARRQDAQDQRTAQQLRRCEKSASHVILFAGGIGITPIWCMVQRLEELGRSWKLYYACRSRTDMAFLATLEHLPARSSTSTTRARASFSTSLRSSRDAPKDAHLYCCGPTPMLNAFEAATADWPREQVHVEYFTPKAQATDKKGGFVVELARSGQEFVIPEGQSILQVLLDAGIDIDYSCELGICGACEQRVISGEPEHRDAILTEEEQASNTKVMICCAGCKSERLVLDL